MTGPTTPLLQVEGLVTRFESPRGSIAAVNGVSFTVDRGETVCIVGESGSGKSVTMASVLGLLPASAQVSAGTAVFDGQNLLGRSERQLQQIRGREIGLVFQDPMSALNPVLRIGAQITEAVRRHTPGVGRRAAKERAVELLSQVGIPQPRRQVDRYPHEFSGGMRQRVMLAIALANRPRLIIADEPTTALDVTVQAQVLELIRTLQQETDAALVLITHDLGVVAQMADRVLVMYGGRIVESGDVFTVFDNSRHPYTRALLRSTPTLELEAGELYSIGGTPPSPQELPRGCSFAPRCDLSHGRPQCGTTPSLAEVEPGHHAACHFHTELAEQVSTR